MRGDLWMEGGSHRWTERVNCGRGAGFRSLCTTAASCPQCCPQVCRAHTQVAPRFLMRELAHAGERSVFCGYIDKTPIWLRVRFRVLAVTGLGAPCSLFDAGGEFLDLVIGPAALGHLLADLLIGVHDGGVVATAEGLADPRQ